MNILVLPRLARLALSSPLSHHDSSSLFGIGATQLALLCGMLHFLPSPHQVIQVKSSHEPFVLMPPHSMDITGTEEDHRQHSYPPINPKVSPTHHR